MVQGVYLSPIHLSIYTPAHASQGEHNAHKDDIRDAAEADGEGDGETRRQEIRVLRAIMTLMSIIFTIFGYNTI